MNPNPNPNMASLMEDIRNYKKSKDDLYEYCETNGYTHEKMKSAIIYYMNDYSPCLYGISKNNYKKIRRITIMIVILKPKLTDISGVLQPMSGIYFYATL